MSKLYIITGPAGVGKSTISKKIAERKNKKFSKQNILDTTNLSIDETINCVESENRFIL